MSTITAFIVETSLLLALLLALFACTRRMVIYGGRTIDMAVVASGVGVGILVGVILFTSHQRIADKPIVETHVAQPDYSANMTPAMKENTGLKYARQKFISDGSLPQYPAAKGDMQQFVPTKADLDARADLLAGIQSHISNMSLMQGRAIIWGLAWLPVVMIAFLLARRERKQLSDHHGFRVFVRPKTFAEVEGFVGMLLAACEDAKLHNTLELILTQPDAGRKAMIRELVTELRAKLAPQELIEAFVCLLDDEVAEKAYVVIHKCERPMALA